MKERKGVMQTFVLKLVLLVAPALIMIASNALAGGVDVHVGIDLPLPGFYVAPAPAFVASPPVVVRRAPVVVVPAPVVVVAHPTVVEYRHVPPGWAKKHYKYKKFPKCKKRYCD